MDYLDCVNVHRTRSSPVKISRTRARSLPTRDTEARRHRREARPYPSSLPLSRSTSQRVSLAQSANPESVRLQAELSYASETAAAAARCCFCRGQTIGQLIWRGRTRGCS